MEDTYVRISHAENVNTTCSHQEQCAEATSQSTIDSSNWMSEKNPTFQLHMVQKKEFKSDRPIINSTKCQRLSFYRAYNASINKTRIICKYSSQFNIFFWLNVINLLFQSLPHTFVQLFIASYAPEQHIFLTKMVPVCIGFNILLIATSLLEILINIDSLLFMFHYFFVGIFLKNPWNRCKNSTYYDESLKDIIHCYPLEEFADQFVNTTYHFSGNVYKNAKNESFQVAQIEYFRLFLENQHYLRNMAYFAVVWIIVASLTIYVTSTYFWKAFHYCHWITMTVDITTFIYLILNGDPSFKPTRGKVVDFQHSIILTQKLWINPSGDSAIIVLSNAAAYGLRGLLTAILSHYCERIVGAPIYYSRTNAQNIFFLWPLFHASFYLGDIYNLLFIGFNFITEILMVTVALRCLLETITTEWNNLKPLPVIFALFIVALFVSTTTESPDGQLLFYIYAKGFVTLTETICIYMLYPVGRLLDDYKFHFGESPTWLRKLSLRLVPYYILGKIIVMVQTLLKVLRSPSSNHETEHYKWSWCLVLLPLVLGIFYIVYKYNAVYKTDWRNVFSPAPQWGPSDKNIKRLRKQYDSRVYLTSNAPRQLSRYLISKAESSVYKIDVRYDLHRRSSTSTSAKEITSIAKEVNESKDK